MDLTTRYMGLELKNPLVASASPLSEKLDAIRRLEDAGAAAVVLFSLFEEQIRNDTAAVERFFGIGAEAHREASSYFPAAEEYDVGPAAYLELIRRATEAVEIPIIASLNGSTQHGWADFAAQMQQAGAAGIELNVYYIPTEMYRPAQHVEKRYLDVLAAVKSAVDIPVAMKIGPYFSSMAHMAGQLDRGGADALVLFNRFYQPDFDIETRTVVPSVSLSRPDEIRLPLLWIAVLHGRVRASLAATTGVHSYIEAVKYLMAGADVVMTTSALLLEGPSFIDRVRANLVQWMRQKGYESVDQLRGCMSHSAVEDPTAFARANYIRSIATHDPAEMW